MTQPPSIRSAKPQCLREDALAVLRRLRDAGHVAYFAGGCVRDELMGLTPTDYDVATDAAPDRVRTLFGRTEAVGQAFGVILVRHGRSVVEVATFRTEGAYLDGRRPQSVQFTSAEQDAQRRDFTINGLFLDPIANQVIDFVGGQDDLVARRLRAIGDPAARFAEDHLRLLRAVRFAARFDLTIEPATAQAISRHAPQLVRISPERIAEELRLMLCPPTRVRAWPMLWEYGLAGQVFRFVQPPEYPSLDAARSIFLAIDPKVTITLGEALAAATLCYQWQLAGMSGDIRELIQPPAVRAAVRGCRKGLRISNDASDEMAGVLAGVATLLADDQPSVAVMKRFLAASTSTAARRLLGAIRAAGLHVGRIDWLDEHLDELSRTEVAPPPLITGDDLIRSGLSPGPAFKHIIHAVYDAQLEDRITTRDEALALARQLAES